MSERGTEEEKTMPLTTALLGGFGVIPFAVGALFAVLPETAHLGRWIVIGYGAVILSFLGGIEWGVGLASKPRNGTAYLVSILISLTGWSALLLDHRLGLMVLAGGFLAALFYDFASAVWFRLPGWFVQLRTVLTCAVLASIAVSLWPFLR